MIVRSVASKGTWGLADCCAIGVCEMHGGFCLVEID